MPSNVPVLGLKAIQAGRALPFAIVAVSCTLASGLVWLNALVGMVMFICVPGKTTWLAIGVLTSNEFCLGDVLVITATGNELFALLVVAAKPSPEPLVLIPPPPLPPNPPPLPPNPPPLPPNPLPLPPDPLQLPLPPDPPKIVSVPMLPIIVFVPSPAVVS